MAEEVSLFLQDQWCHLHQRVYQLERRKRRAAPTTNETFETELRKAEELRAVCYDVLRQVGGLSMGQLLRISAVVEAATEVKQRTARNLICQDRAPSEF